MHTQKFNCIVRRLGPGHRIWGCDELIPVELSPHSYFPFGLCFAHCTIKTEKPLKWFSSFLFYFFKNRRADSFCVQIMFLHLLGRTKLGFGKSKSECGIFFWIWNVRKHLILGQGLDPRYGIWGVYLYCQDLTPSDLESSSSKSGDLTFGAFHLRKVSTFGINCYWTPVGYMCYESFKVTHFNCILVYLTKE